MAVDEFWGCGITAYDREDDPAGSVVCWEVQGSKTGGHPPGPTIHPGAARAPWTEPDSSAPGPFDGPPDQPPPTFIDIAVAGSTPETPWICATTASDALGSTTACWDGEVGGPPVRLSSTLEGLSMSANVLCGTIAELGTTACFGRDGSLALSLLEPLLGAKVVGATHICGIEDTGGGSGPLACFDEFGNDVTLPGELSSAEVVAFDGNTANGDAFGCAVLADGRVSCFDLDPSSGVLPPPAPVDGGFVDVAVGEGTLCATKTDGQVVCTRHDGPGPDVMHCGQHTPPPPVATDIQIDNCVACGLEENGFGLCWPTNWDRKVGEGEELYGGGGGGGTP